MDRNPDQPQAATLIVELGRACRERLLAEKWLVAPSLRIGHQWLENLSLAGGCAVNVHIKTLKNMAIQLAAPEMAGGQLRLMPEGDGPVIVGAAWELARQQFAAAPRGGRRSGAGGYLWRMAPSYGLFERAARSLNDLRLAGLGPDHLAAARFEEESKGRDIAALMRHFLAELGRRRLIDYAGLLELARRRLESDAVLLPEAALLLIPADLVAAPLEEQFIQALPSGRRISLAVDLPAAEAASAEAHDIELLRWIGNPPAAPPPRGDGSAEIFSAVGEVNEVREVLRRLLETGRPFDSAELLYTDASRYLPLIYELASSLLPRRRTDAADAAHDRDRPGDGDYCDHDDPGGDDHADDSDDADDDDDADGETGGDTLPVTFAQGVPLRYSRPGRALAAWLKWLSDGYPQSILARMIQDGLLHRPALADDSDDPPGSSPRLPFVELAGLLRTVSIGAGRERYLALLDEHIAASRRDIDGPARRREDGDANPDAMARLHRRRRGLQVLREMIANLLAVSPSAEPQPREVLAQVAEFLRHQARGQSQLDNLARRRLLDAVTGMESLLADGGAVTGLNVWTWLAGLLGGLCVGGSGPRPGRLHVALAQTGGHSGRPWTFIVGLDDSRFQEGGLQDPLLLDMERKRLSPRLLTRGEQLSQRLDSFERMLARLRGRVTLSYACRDVTEDRDIFPCLALLNAYRLVSGDRRGDLTRMQRWLATPASFAPDRPERCLEPGEWWLWRLCGPGSVRVSEEVLAESYPHLGRGWRAREARRSDEFTAYDGRVEPAGHDLDPTQPAGPVMSTKWLELIGRCPLAYFFSRVLKIADPEERRVDPLVWLDPLNFGLLLHEVFYEFMAELLPRRQAPTYTEHANLLRRILGRRVEACRTLFPPPNEDAYRRQRRQLDQACYIFLKEEEVQCRFTEPLYLEASIGLPSSGGGTPIDRRQAVALDLPGGRQFRACGRMDRVDRRRGAPDKFLICDYKTGTSVKKYLRKDPFWQGRLVQHVLYLLMADRVLREKVSPSAEVTEFDFFFPGYRTRGQRIWFSRDILPAAGPVLGALCEIAAKGAFLQSTDYDDCGYCDLRPVCEGSGDLPEQVAANAAKLAKLANELLRPMRELRER